MPTAQINLLPEVKQKKNTANRRRQLASAITVILVAVCVGVVVIVLLFRAGQRLRINQLQGQIDERQEKVQSYKELPQAMTVQAHLAALPGLYGQRAYMTKLFQTVQNFSTREISISSAGVDANNELKVSGVGRTYQSIMKFAKALEAANVTVGAGASETNQPYFTNIQIGGAASQENKVSFDLTATVSQGVTSGNP